MLNDIATILCKEWHELILQRGTRSGLFNWLMPVALVGIFMPIQAGAKWVSHPVVPLLWAWPPVLAVMWIMSDSFAGERERHTLETLLSSRLSDRAILIGKILTGVIYGWSIEVCSLLLAVVTVNLRAPHSGFYALPTFLNLLGLSLVVLLLTCAAGALVSLHAPTVRSAYQRINLAIFAIGLVAGLGFRLIPLDARNRIVASLSTGKMDLQTVILLGVVLWTASAILFVLTFTRFHRSQLVLD
jgi:ABC-2 type transport system permease protein